MRCRERLARERKVEMFNIVVESYAWVHFSVNTSAALTKGTASYT